MGRTVLAFGSFDVLHPGHLLYLKRAKARGDLLIVVIARDSTISMIKGRAPVFNEKERLGMVEALKMVDKAVLGGRVKDPEGMYNILKKYKPDIVVLGYDQNATGLKEWVEGNKLNIKVVRLRKGFRTGRFKSSKVKEALERGL